MLNKHSMVLMIVVLLATSNQTVFASYEFDTEAMTACVPVGKIAMKMIDLIKAGHEKETIEATLKEQLDQNLSLWITPISSLVFSNTEQSSETVTKKAIGYCLNIIKIHRQPREANLINT